MRYILGIDTASAEGSVALAAEGRTLASLPLRPGEHSSGLSVAVDELLRGVPMALHHLAGLAVSKGPGSFTGLRIGLAWAKGVAMGRDLPLVLVSAHEAAAHAHRGRAPRIATLIPGERGQVEVAIWRGGERAVLVGGIATMAEEEAVAHAREVSRETDGAGGRRVDRGGAVALVPSTSKLARALEEDMEEGMALIPISALAPAVAEIGDRLLCSGERADPMSASPAYGRPPNARKPAR